MTSRTTERFRNCFAHLPDHVKTQARQAYHRFKLNPEHPGLRFKRVHSTRPIHCVRISLDYRALGVLAGSEVIWFWIGTHADYESLLSRL